MSIFDERLYALTGWHRLAWCIRLACSTGALMLFIVAAGVASGNVHNAGPSALGGAAAIALLGGLIWAFGRGIFYVSTGR